MKKIWRPLEEFIGDRKKVWIIPDGALGGVSFQTREIDREVANVVSDSEINAQVQVINTTNAFTDAAKAAVNNLNNQSPVGVSVPSTLTMVTDVLGSGVNYYNKLSTAQRSDLKQNMKIAQSKIESILKF